MTGDYIVSMPNLLSSIAWYVDRRSLCAFRSEIPLCLQMGLAAAEAVVRGGFTLVPYTLTGSSIGVAVQKQAVEGIPVEVVGPDSRQEAMEMILEKYPRLVVVDYTLPR